MIQSSPVTGGAAYSPRRAQLRRHGVWLVAAAALAFAAGIVAGMAGPSAEQDVAARYARAWERGDYAAMHGLLTEDARRATSLERFTQAHRRAAATATTLRLRAGTPAEPDDGTVRVPVAVRTRVFGPVRETVDLPVEEDGDTAAIAWKRHLVFPGLREGERLTRRTRLPERAPIRAADGTLLAGEPLPGTQARSSSDPDLAASIAGTLGPIPPERARELRAEGVPSDAQVGLTGLERALDDEVRGRPGGDLRAGRRTLAISVPEPAAPVRSTIVPRVQRAAVEAIGPRVGGVVALDPRSGAVTAAAGIGLSGLQPPGSTFKILTLVGGLEQGITKPAKRYPVERETQLEGVDLENANGEACGGTLMESFAESCNTVFAPMGAELGAEKLVEVAERFGFNAPPGIDGAATSTIPPAGEVGDDLAVGSSAIGQGKVQASALQMAVAAAAIAARGRRPVPTLVAGARPRSVRVTEPGIAQIVARAMRAVVKEGTGTAAAIDGVGVAGKTGTAELRSTVAPPQGEEGATPPPAADPTDTTAWFSAYAPVSKPRVAVGVLLTEAGAGGATAAPAAKIVLAAALGRAAEPAGP
jgi:hypothetical protein